MPEAARRRQARGLRARQRGRRRQRLRQLAASGRTAASCVDEDGNVAINSKETIEALKYLKELYPTFIAGHDRPGATSATTAPTAASEIWLTANGVSLYFALKNDPATLAIAEDTEHSLLPKGRLNASPMAGLTLERHGVQAQQVPNAAKALLQFMLEKEQYDPWLQREPRLLVAAARDLFARAPCGRAIRRSRSSGT